MVGAQTKGQFHLIYGDDGTQALLTGLATQVVYGGCDYNTADFYSKTAGTATADTNPDPHKASYRQRPLLTVDEIINPQDGNCTVFARFVEPGYAGQVILTARLTRLYERDDWQERFRLSAAEEPLCLERGLSVGIVDSEPAIPVSERARTDAWVKEAAERLDETREKMTADSRSNAAFDNVPLDHVKAKFGPRL